MNLEQLLPSDIDRSGLVPQRYVMSDGRTVRYFVDNHLELVRFDFVFEAGTAFQDKKFQSAGAVSLIAEGTRRRTAQEIAEFMDCRGILLDKNNDVLSSTLTVYTLSRYVGELLPMLREVIEEAAYPQREFDIYMSKRRQQLLTNLHKTSYIARLGFNGRLYGRHHPLGSYAEPADIDRITVDDVRRFHREYMQLSKTDIVVSGAVTDEVLHAVDRCFSCSTQPQASAASGFRMPAPQPENATGYHRLEVPAAVQNTLRVGRLLPFSWDDPRIAPFMVLSTVLGGYFGSRLMSNIREDKGYTYGVNALTQINRDSISFYILTDVASDKAEAAMKEIMNELERLRSELVPEEELQLVRSCMLGDFMRSIDGIFERAERYEQMIHSGIDERFTDNFMAALEPHNEAVTPAKLRELAREVLNPDELLLISAGQVQ